MTNIPSKLLRNNNFLKLLRSNILNKPINLRENVFKDSHNETTSVENLIINFNKRWNNITKEEFKDNFIKYDESKTK
jgi:hypothetical protein